jgi:hypothetical protein
MHSNKGQRMVACHEDAPVVEARVERDEAQLVSYDGVVLDGLCRWPELCVAEVVRNAVVFKIVQPECNTSQPERHACASACASQVHFFISKRHATTWQPTHSYINSKRSVDMWT